MNPLRCAHVGQHIGFMDTGPSVQTNVWKCLHTGNPTTGAMCHGCRACRPAFDLGKLPLLIHTASGKPLSEEKLRSLAAAIALADGTEPPPAPTYAEGET